MAGIDGGGESTNYFADQSSARRASVADPWDQHLADLADAWSAYHSQNKPGGLQEPPSLGRFLDDYTNRGIALANEPVKQAPEAREEPRDAPSQSGGGGIGGMLGGIGSIAGIAGGISAMPKELPMAQKEANGKTESIDQQFGSLRDSGVVPQAIYSFINWQGKGIPARVVESTGEKVDWSSWDVPQEEARKRPGYGTVIDVGEQPATATY